MAPLSLVFAGTPEFAARHLAALVASEHLVTACYTQPDRPAGRGKQLTASPVKALALEHQLPVMQPVNFKRDEDCEALAALAPDVLVVVAYGLLLPQRVLDIPRLGCINVHASLLPRWRGAAPIQRAIEAGDAQTGVTIMQMEAGLDTGPMLAKVTCPILPDQTAGQLHDVLAELGPPSLLQVLGQLAAGTAKPEVQDARLATYAHKLSKDEAVLHWQQPASALAQRVWAFNPFPMACLICGDLRIRALQARALPLGSTQAPGTLVAIGPEGLDVATQDGLLRITQVQLPGKNPVAVQALLHGQHPFNPGMRFGI